MPQLVIEQPGVLPTTIPVAADTIHFGRAEDNDVVLVADEVSRHHAMLCRRQGKVVLIDKKSMNGTYVNRQRIVERVLSHCDEIWFGSKCRIVYRDDTDFGQEKKSSDSEVSSQLLRDVDKIRAEMDRVGDSLTMIAKKGRTPEPADRLTLVDKATPDDVLTIGRAYRRLSALYRATKLIASDFDLSKRLADVLDTAVEVMEADRGFVLLRDDHKKTLQVSVAREMGHELAASSPSMGIAGKAAIDGEPVLMADAATDEEFGERQSIIAQRITSAMAVPLKVEDNLLGSIYVDTRKREVRFNEEDLELFASLAAQSALAIQNVRLHEQMIEGEKKRASLSRFLSPAIVEEIMREDSALELGGRKRVVTTLFCDIRGFTQISEQTSPQKMVEMLNQHFSAMTDIIFEHSGTLDKYIGDAIMAVFGAPLSVADDAERAVRAAMAMQMANNELNKQRARDGRPELRLGIGINTGEVIAGYMGSPNKMEFTVVGDHVNIASRLCDLAKPRQILVGGSTYEFIKEKIPARAIGTVMLDGKAIPVQVYEIFDMNG